MTRSHRTFGSRRLRGLAAGAAIVAALAVTAAPASAVPSAGSAVAVAGALPSFRLADMAMKDGVVLKADVFTPAPGTPGADERGRYPAIVQPASWGQNDLEYIAQGRQLAADGYVVVTYTVRGFWLSGGKVDVAGPTDVADISSVIDWTLAHTSADPRRLGMTGLSLGGGLTLMGAAFDPRIKAVAAMSGWGDLTDSLYSGQTRHLQAAAFLTAIQTPTGRRGAELDRALADLFADRELPEVVKWAQTRSPATYVDRINANGTAVFLANAWGDSIFNPSEIAAFYQRLTGPKRLELRPGDHATQELTSLLGLHNATWASARAWFDQHLKGAVADTRQPVELEVRPSGRHESYPDWQSVGSHAQRLRLGSANLLGTGTLGGAATTGWHTSVVGGTDSGADGGPTELSGLLDQVAKLSPTVVLPLLPRSAGAVWQSAPYAAAQQIRGSAKLHTTVTASASEGTVFGYLYDVNALGVGKLISHAPQSWSGRQPGQAFPLDVSLFATAYDLPAGHRLALVLDTKDPLYGGRTPLGSRVSFSSPADDPSELTLPLR
ncbi:CocE/NonD family hydrolase [Kitasatospora atroaurantiaca]|uniref:Putative CocE/NonD family hydrolase n=1 Tax=Kitasatospora atroaurantiaca TaxID=285545 RepID=A0A561EIT1_9ACTN|nr:CocE/NonD family hydrolase [Kitasatospora atroaurantiaca]TWE15520.1 putative CocE/NonD family hydrolase [Kitasatospora atroaurantiaca]